MSMLISKIFYVQMIAVMLMVLGVLPQESSYFILAIMCYGFYKMDLIDSLKLFIISLPFFTALPESRLSDSMSMWRILIIVLFIKMMMGQCAHSVCGMNFVASVKNIFLKNIPTKEKTYYRLFIFFILFIFANIISLVGAHYIGAGIKKILFILNISFLFPILQSAIKTREDATTIMNYMLKCSIAVVFVGYFQLLLTFFVPLFKFWQFWTNSVINVFYGRNLSELLSYSNTWFSYYDVLPATLRMFSVFPDSHSFSMFVLFSMPLILFFAADKEEKRRKGLILLIPICLLALFFSGSRGVWASYLPAVFVSLFIFVDMKSKMNNFKDLFFRMTKGSQESANARTIILSMLIFFILMPVSGFVLRKNQEVQLARVGAEISDFEEEAMFKRLVSISNLSEASNMGRIEIWSRTMRSINDHYFFGIGAGNFPLILDEELGTAKMGSSAHNIYFDVAAETGVVGLLFFVLIIFEILRYSLNIFKRCRVSDHMRIFAGAFFAYFLWIAFYGLFDVVLLNDKVLIFFVLSAGILYSFRDERLKQN